MNQFNLGDKVVRLDTGGDDIIHGMHIGKVYTVSDNQHGWLTFVELPLSAGNWNSKYFKLVNEKDEEKMIAEPQKHVHAELIIAWANGAVIEQQNQVSKVWTVVKQPSWAVNSKFRLKVVKPEFETHLRRVVFNVTQNPEHSYLTWYTDGTPNVEVTVKTETGEVVKIVQI